MNFERYVAGIRLQQQLVEGKRILEQNELRNKQQIEQGS